MQKRFKKRGKKKRKGRETRDVVPFGGGEEAGRLPIWEKKNSWGSKTEQKRRKKRGQRITRRIA